MKAFSEALAVELKADEHHAIDRALESLTHRLALNKDDIALVVRPEALAQEIRRRDTLLDALTVPTASSLDAAASFLSRIRAHASLPKAVAKPVVERLLRLGFEEDSQWEDRVTEILELLGPGAVGSYLADLALQTNGTFLAVDRISKYSGLSVERRTFSKRILEKASSGDASAKGIVPKCLDTLLPSLDRSARIDIQELLLQIAESPESPKPLRVDALMALRYGVEDPWLGDRRGLSGTSLDPVAEALIGIARANVGSLRTAAFSALLAHVMILHRSSFALTHDAGVDSLRRIYAESSLAERLEMTGPICGWVGRRSPDQDLSANEWWLLREMLHAGAVAASDSNQCLSGLLAHADLIGVDDLRIDSLDTTSAWGRRLDWGDILPYMMVDADPAVRQHGQDVARQLLRRADAIGEVPLHPAVVAFLVRSRGDRKRLFRLAAESDEHVLGVRVRDFVAMLGHDGELPRFVSPDGTPRDDLREMFLMIRDATTVLWSNNLVASEASYARLQRWPGGIRTGDERGDRWFYQLRALAHAHRLRISKAEELEVVLADALAWMDAVGSGEFVVPILRVVDAASEHEAQRPKADALGFPFQAVANSLVRALGYQRDEHPCVKPQGEPDNVTGRLIMLQTLGRLLEGGRLDLAALERAADETCYIPTDPEIELASSPPLDHDRPLHAPAQAALLQIVLGDIACDTSAAARRAIVQQLKHRHRHEQYLAILRKLQPCDQFDEVLAHNISLLDGEATGESIAESASDSAKRWREGTADILDLVPHDATRWSALNESRLAAATLAAHASTERQLEIGAALLHRLGPLEVATDGQVWALDGSLADSLALFGREAAAAKDIAEQLQLVDDGYPKRRSEWVWSRYLRGLEVLSMYELIGTPQCTLQPDELVRLDSDGGFGPAGTFVRPVLAQVLWRRLAASSGQDPSPTPGLGHCGGGVYDSGEFPQLWLNACEPLWTEILLMLDSGHECRERFAWLLAYNSLLHRPKPTPAVADQLLGKLAVVKRNGGYAGEGEWSRLFGDVEARLLAINQGSSGTTSEAGNGPTPRAER